MHSIDLHAVTGPGGAATVTMAKPGEEHIVRFRASNPGVYIYHCSAPHVPTHIALGMYGLIVVEPPGGLPKVDREFYLVQGEIYTEGNRSTTGHLAFDGEKTFHEDPNYVVFNGQFKGLTSDPAVMKATRGERIRLFVGNAGPNLTSSFHVIGEIFDHVHPEGATETITNVATTATRAPSPTSMWRAKRIPPSLTRSPGFSPGSGTDGNKACRPSRQQAVSLRRLNWSSLRATRKWNASRKSTESNETNRPIPGRKSPKSKTLDPIRR